ncbi:MAG: hypothetical protein R3C49_10605 [Planctomycetaceae bacterium]
MISGILEGLGKPDRHLLPIEISAERIFESGFPPVQQHSSLHPSPQPGQTMSRLASPTIFPPASSLNAKAEANPDDEWAFSHECLTTWRIELMNSCRSIQNQLADIKNHLSGNQAVTLKIVSETTPKVSLRLDSVWAPSDDTVLSAIG